MAEETPIEEKQPGVKLTPEEEKKLDFFMSTPLRSASRLMKELYSNDEFYQTAVYAWTGPEDAKKLFLYGVCKEVMKACIGLMGDKEVLGEMPADAGANPVGKVVTGAITDVQTYRIRKLIELLSLLILFDRNTTRDEEYRIYLSAENLDLNLSQQEDFRELHDGRIISNTQHSIHDYAERIQRDLKGLGVTDLWFLNRRRLKDQKPSVFESRKRLYLAALLAASPDERLALGISYGRGYSRASQSVHPLLGSHDYRKEDDHRKRLLGNFANLSIIAMHVMHLSYKLAGKEDPGGLATVMGEKFEKSDAPKALADLAKDLEVGDLVLTAWMDLGEILAAHISKYGYTAYRIKYLSRPPLPEYPEDWLESQHITARLLAKGKAREFFEKNTSPDRMPGEVKAIWPEIMKQSDDALMESAKHFFVDMHKIGALIPMLLETGFLKKRDAL